eukprot:s770_g8.t1
MTMIITMVIRIIIVTSIYITITIPSIAKIIVVVIMGTFLSFHIRILSTSIATIIAFSTSTTFIKVLGPDCREWVAKGLHPGDAALPIVRAYNEIGYSEWSRMPIQEEVEALSSKPDTPEAMTTPPRIERTVVSCASAGIDRCVVEGLAWPSRLLFRADTEDDLKAIREAGKVPPPPPSDEPLEFTVVPN